MNFSKGKELESRLSRVVPGGGHTYSKGSDQFPVQAPGLIVRGKGAFCWDADGNKFLDYGMGLRSVGIGHSNDEINAAVVAELSNGTNFTRPGVLELELAEKYVDLIPSIEMVKFGKNGSDATSAAVRLARAFTGRKYMAICSDHPFFSVNDWFIGSTPCSNGVPEEIQRLTLKFRYNDIQSLRQLFVEYPDQIAGVILEPLKNVEPQNNFLQELRALTQKNGTLLIFDEMISGFRWDIRGAQFLVDVKPDLTTFGKATANGFSLSVLGGRKDVMELGGLTHNKERVFLLSQTHGAESVGLAASLKNIEIYQRDKVVEHHWAYGKKFMDGINGICKELGIDENFKISGYACSPIIVAMDKDKNPNLEFHTLFQQEMIKHQVLMPWISFCRDHTDVELDFTLEAARKSLAIYRNALETSVDKFLVGRAVKPVWRRYN